MTKVNTKNNSYFSVVSRFIKEESLRHEYAHNNYVDKFKNLYKGDVATLNDNNTSNFWDNKYAQQNNQDSPMKNNIYDDAAKIVDGVEGNVLNIGFGTGEIEKRLKNKNKNQLYGLDLSVQAVERMNIRGYSNYQIGSIYDQSDDILTKFYRMIVLMDVIEHITPDKTLSVLKKINNNLKKDGFLLVTIPVNENLEEMLYAKNNPNQHMRIYSLDILKKELELTGFVVEKHSYYYAFSNNYRIKSLLVKLSPNVRKPNGVLVLARKQ